MDLTSILIGPRLTLSAGSRSKNLPKKIKAGKLSGPSHKKGGILLEAEGGEYIIKKSSVKKLGKKTLDKINRTGKLPRINKNTSAGSSIKTYASGGYVEGE